VLGEALTTGRWAVLAEAWATTQSLPACRVNRRLRVAARRRRRTAYDEKNEIDEIR